MTVWYIVAKKTTKSIISLLPLHDIFYFNSFHDIILKC